MNSELMTVKHYEMAAKMAIIEILVRDEFNRETDRDLITDFLQEFRTYSTFGSSFLEIFNKEAEKDRRQIPKLREHRRRILLDAEVYMDNNIDINITKSKVINQ
jgi:hypothetical protein